jgi:putative ABC transport system permease protein
MLRNYLKIAVRNLVRHKLSTSINIFSLAVGLALCVLVIGYISYELSFEDMHQNKSRIYRVDGDYTFREPKRTYVQPTARVMGPLGFAMADQIPEIEKAAVFRHFPDVTIERDNREFKAGHLICANPDFLDVFTFPLLRGDPQTALDEPFSILITQEASQEFFPGQDPVGRTVKIKDMFEGQITGVLKNIPSNTQLKCDFVASYSSLKRIGHDTESWHPFESSGGFPGDFVYLLLKKGAAPADVEQKIPALLRNHLEAETADNYNLGLRPLKKIYFDTLRYGLVGGLEPFGETEIVYIFGIIAIFVLIMAIANFVNLSTARSADRMKEVGVRKVFGAFRKHLVKQFLGESLVITFFSLLLSLAVYELIKPQFNLFFKREATAAFFDNSMMLLGVVGLGILVGVLSGFYPALYLSRFKPIAVLQSKAGTKSSRSTLRRALVVFQFTIAVIFICSTLITQKQLQYITSLDLGFERDNILVLDFEGDNAEENCQLMKHEILKNTRALSATSADCPPGRMNYVFYRFYTDEARENDIVVRAYHVDYDFISMFGLEITQGRGFSEDYAADVNLKIIINESGVKHLGIENPIGYRLYRQGGKFYEVVGVVKDFHGSIMSWAQMPVTVINLSSERRNTLSVKLPPEDISGSIAAIKNTWETVLPGEVFEYAFLDDEIDRTYDDQRLQRGIFATLSLLTIAVACLGIFGLVSYTAVRRTKEIGIRKVLGATVTGVVTLLSKEFVILVGISNLIGWPVAYLIMSSFLQDFAFRVGIGPGVFLSTGVVVAVLALLTASYQAIKVALTNPVETIRYE